MEFKKVNVEYLNEVCDNSPDLIREMIEIFRSQVVEFKDEMESLHSGGEYYDLGLLAHKAKSSVSIMGMEDLALRLKELEKNAKEGVEPEKYRYYIDNFASQTRQALDELDSYLETL